MRRCFAFVPQLEISKPKIVFGIGVIRPNPKRFLTMRDSFIQPALPHQQVSQARVRKIVLFSDRYCVSPKDFAVAPITRLASRRPCESCDQNCRGRAYDRSQRIPARTYFGHSPNNDEIKTDLRQICVAIGVTLQSHLNDSDDRHQHRQVPQPSNDEIRTASA